MPPEVVSHYRVLEPLGRGGMGVVYKGRDERLGRIVALKFLSGDRLESASDRRRFFEEAKALSALNHPHIATVYEVDEAAGIPFMAMEYLPGGTLRGRMEQTKKAGGHLSFESLVSWGVGLAEALEHAHARGVIHRDVKTSNVMFDGQNRIKLTDFGLAKVAGADDVTASGAVAGTMAYMAPEQLAGEGADHRSDLYALGVVLYETATGALPFPGNSPAEMVERILHQEAPSPGRVRPELPQAFDGVVARLMAKAPAERYQSAIDVRRDLLALHASEAGRALDSTKSAGHARAASRSGHPRWIAWAGAGLAAALAAGSYLSVRPPEVPERKHLVVLPIRSIGGDARQQEFCDGLTETLTTTLAQVGAFSVVPASDTRRIATVEQARTEFGVNLVLYASLQRSGEDARLSLSLVDAESKRTIRAVTVEGPLQKLYQSDEGVVAQVADMVGFVLPRDDSSILAAGGVFAPAAFDAYVRGRGLLFRFDRPGNLERALDEFEEAIRLEPSLALAYVGIAEAQLRIYRSRRTPDILAAARASSERALALSPDLVPGRVVLGAILAESGKFNDAERELKAALKADDRDPAAYRELAGVYNSQKRYDEAEAVYRRAILARPGEWLSFADLAAFLYGRQRFADAAQAYGMAIQLEPDNHLGYRNLGGVLHAMGKNEEAEAMLRKAQAIHPTARGFSNLGTVLMIEHRYAEALTELKQAAELSATEAPNEYRIWGNLGDAHWLAGSPPGPAREAWRKAAEIAETRLARRPDNSDLEAVLAEYYAKLQDRGQALAHLQSALARSPQSSVVHYQAAVVHALLHDVDAAVRELFLSIALGDVKAQIAQSPELAALRAAPQFREVEAKLRSVP